MMLRNRWQSLSREIPLWELIKLIPDDEFVVIFHQLSEGTGFQEADAVFNGQVVDWWREEAAIARLMKMRVVGIRPCELETVAEAVTMIVVDY